MAVLDGPILPSGAIVDLRAEVSGPRAAALRNLGQPIPAAIPLRALIDTGADATFIDTRHLPFVSQQTPTVAIVGTPAGGWTVGLQYDVSLTVVHPQGARQSNLRFQSHPIIDLALAASLGYEALLGRDILQHCLLVYDGRTNRFTLGY